jgi:hypothetical protein
VVLTVTITEGSNNGLAELARLLEALDLTGRPAFPSFTVGPGPAAEHRRDTIIRALQADPRIISVT